MENGQARNNLLDHLDRCCLLIGELYGKPDITSWINSDYIRLGYILHKKTSVRISPNTLKRIFGKLKTDERYYPQKATRDALAQYLGFRDWEQFVDKGKPVSNTPRELKMVNEPPPNLKLMNSQPVVIVHKNHWLRKLGWAAFTLLIIFLLYEGIQLSKPQPIVTLECSNPVGHNPHTATFMVRGLSESMKKRYLINFGDGKKMSLVSGDSIFSHYYEVPGRFVAVLYQEGMPLDSVPVFLQTNGWVATADMMYDTTRVYPIRKSNLISDSKAMAVSALDVSRAGVDTNRTFFVRFVNTQFSEIDGDNFDLFLRLKTSEDRAGVRCSQVRVTVFGEESNHELTLLKPGCEHWSNMQISEIGKSGRFSKLDFLAVDLHEGGTLDLNVKEKHASILINSEKVHETTYQKPLKKVYGLGIFFSGIGEIQSVVLKDKKTGKTFNGDF